MGGSGSAARDGAATFGAALQLASTVAIPTRKFTTAQRYHTPVLRFDRVPGGAEYQFVAWTRSGIGALLGGVRRQVTLDLGANGQAGIGLATYAPSDVAGLDPRAVVRTVPQHGVRDFEPNLFASVELAHPALPWLVSGPADAAGHVMPWLALVVVAEGQGVTVTQQALTIAWPAIPAMELPMLAQAWAWAHAQAVASEGAALDPMAFATSRTAARSRLIAPRQLAPETRYIACIVPTTPGWTGSEPSITLPVYYRWRFATGPSGDFASLVKRVTPTSFGAEVGHRTVDVSAPGWGAPAAPGATIEASAALRSLAWEPSPLSPAAVAIGTTIAAELATVPPLDEPPVLAPPSYGSAVTLVDDLAAAPAWQAALDENVDQRIAASLGADVIRSDLDRFVDAAWRSAGDAERINHTLRLGELAGAIAQRLGDKHLGSLSDGELVAVARPLAARMTLAPSTTLAATITASSMPQTALSASLRRLGRPSGTLTRRSAATTTGTMLARIDAKEIAADPGKTLATSAAGFDAISVATRTAARIGLATPASVTAAASHWTTRVAMSATARTVDVTHVPPGEKTLPKLPSHGASREQIDAFTLAARRHQHYITTHLHAFSDPRPPLGEVGAPRPLAEVRTAIAAQWTAERGILPIIKSRVSGIEIASFTPIAATPVLEQPMIRTLATIAPDRLAPGVASMDPNRMAIATPSFDFVRAFLVGANEQLARELLWRRFPGALGHTWLRTFWGRMMPGPDGAPVATPDIPPIESWPDAGPPPPPDMLVFAVRADVLHRYPNALVYAVAAAWQPPYRVVGTGDPVMPVFATTLGTDIALFGFPLSVDVVKGAGAPTGPAGYYFVIAEHPHEPRFGLAASSTPSPTSWADIAWSDVIADDLVGSYLKIDGPLAHRVPGGQSVGADGAETAKNTLRPTVRVAVHASTLVP